MSLAWSPDGRTLASGAYNGLVRLWEANEGSPP
jgi:WD40 repeat protein